MVGSTDTRVVELQFDNSNFEKNIGTSIASLRNLNDSLGLENSRTGSRNLADAFTRGNGSILGAITNVNSGFSAMEIIGKRALERLTDYAMSTAKRLADKYITGPISDGFAKMGQKNSSIRTILNAVSDKYAGGEEEALEKVNSTVEKLMWFSDETSYSFTDMISNISKFTATGADLEKSADVMMGIANAAAMAGQNSAEAGRVMYNMAQAYGSGSVKLIDWKSVENANVATEKLKQTIMDAAVAQGTLVKDKKGNYKTKKGRKTVTTGTFNETLATGWFTSGVMEEAFGTYSKFSGELYNQVEETGKTATELLEIINKVKEGTADPGDVELVNGMIKNLGITATDSASEVDILTESVGLMAFKSAQEAKTFQDAIDAIMDVVSTGWLEVFEAIFGDFKENSKIWTAFANEVSTALYFIPGTIAEIAQKWDMFAGRENLMSSIANLWSFFGSVLSPIGESFTDIFGSLERIALDLAINTKKFEMFTKAIQPSEETLALLKDTFTGVFAIAKIVLSSLIERVKALTPLVDIFKSLAGAILVVVAWIGRLATKLSKNMKANNSYAKSASRMTKFVQALKTAYEQFIKKFKESAIFKKISGYVEELNQKFETMSSISGALKAIWEFLKKSATDIWTSFKNLAGQSKILTYILNKLSPITDKLQKVLDPIKKKLGDIKAKLIAGWEKITAWVDGFIDADDKVQYLKESFADLETKVVECFDNMKAKWEEVKKAYADNGLEGVADVLTGDPEMVDGWIAKWTELKETFSKEGIKGVLDTVWADLLAFKEKVLDWLANLFYGGDEIGSDGGDAGDSLIDTSKIAAKKAREIFDEKLQPHIDALKLWFEETKKEVVSWFTGLWPVAEEENDGGVDSFVTNTTAKVEKGLTEAKDSILEKLTSIVESIKAFFKKLWNGSGEDTATEGSDEVIQNTTEGVEEVFDNITSSVNETVVASIEDLKTKVEEPLKQLDLKSILNKLLIALAIFGVLKTIWKVIGLAGKLSDFNGEKAKASSEKVGNFAKVLFGLAATVLALAVALVLFEFAAEKFGKMTPETLQKAILPVIGSVAVIVGAIAIMNKTVGEGGGVSLGTAASIIAMTGSLFLIAMALERFKEVVDKAMIDDKTKKRYIIALGAMVAIIAVMAGAMWLMKSSGHTEVTGEKLAININSQAMTILALVGSLFLVAMAIERFATIPANDLKKGGIVIGAILAAIGVVMFFMKDMSFSVKDQISGGTKMPKMFWSFVGMAVAIYAVGNAIVKIITVGTEGEIWAAGNVMAVIIIAMGAVLEIMKRTEISGKNLFKNALLMGLIVGALYIVALEMIKIMQAGTAEQILAAGISLGFVALMIGAVAALMSVVKGEGLASAAANAITFLSVAAALVLAGYAITEVAPVGSALDVLTYGAVLVAIVAGIGLVTAAVSALTGEGVGAILTGIGFVAVAESLVLAGEAIASVSTVGTPQDVAAYALVLEAVALGMGVILTAVAALTFEGVGAVLTGIGFVAIAEALKTAADAIVECASVDTDKLETAKTAMLGILAAMAAVLVAVSLFGTEEGGGAFDASKLDGFGEWLQTIATSLGTAMVTVSDAMAKVAEVTTEQLETAKTAMLGILAAMAAVMLSIALFGKGEDGTAFPTEEETSSLFSFLTDVATKLAELGNLVLTSLSPALAEISAVDSSGIETNMSALATAFETLFFGGWFSGTKENSISLISSLATALKDFNGVDFAGITSIATITTALGAFFTSIKGIKINGKSKDAITEYIQMLKDSIAELETIEVGDAATKAAYIADSLANSVKALSDPNSSSMMIDPILQVRDLIIDIATSGTEMTSGLASTISEGMTKVTNAARGVVGSALTEIRSYISKFTQAGKDMIAGLAKGMQDSSQVQALEQAAAAVGEKALNALKKKLGIASPSKEFAKLGVFSVAGFNKGIDSKASSVEESVEVIGTNAIDTMKSTISNISSILASGIDDDLVIKPIVDLSDVRSGAGEINSLFGSGTRKLAGSVSTSRYIAENSVSDDTVQNGSTTVGNGATYSFVQNNYSPKALSRSEIYRQTKNQFSMLKGLAEV